MVTEYIGIARKNGSLNSFVNSTAMRVSGRRVPNPDYEVLFLRFNAGEDIVDRLFSVSQSRSRAIRIMSGFGSIARVTVYVDDDRSSEYWGNYNLLSLDGSVNPLYFNGINASTWNFTISMAAPDGAVIAGRTADTMITASETTIVVFLSPPEPMHDTMDDNGPEVSAESSTEE
ncbi:hypothetical protein LguiA_031956 [Lonicera macranthoides]